MTHRLRISHWRRTLTSGADLCPRRRFTCLLPIPLPGLNLDSRVSTCIWCETPLLYGQQLDILILLQRLVEHFAAAALNIEHSASTDTVRMLVPAVIAIIADVTLRTKAADYSSQARCRSLAIQRRNGKALDRGVSDRLQMCV